uniref:Uncharacterized protein n=1 Tax=Zooxanthella nutricula TaxID=1333877 RepID=A0A7S2QF90_9DINO
MWPGALVFPRAVVYPGEEEFGGPVDYAVEMRFDYSHVPGKVVTIIGHGAFTMENIRTCLEESAKHIYVLCRKMNLTCPRPVSWLINQANPPLAGAQVLNMLQRVYKHIIVDGQTVDPWEMHSVHGNAARTNATIMQKTRFGIGDVYFLAAAYGLMEIVIGEVKRMTHHTLHLNTGRKLQCEAVLKCTGCLGDWKVDKLLHIREMRGIFVNLDPRRVVSGEADGINASQFAATTAGPGYYSMAKMVLHFWDTPGDWTRLTDIGVLDMLPTSRAGEPNEEFPAYFFTAAHAQSSSILLEGSSPLLAMKSASGSEYKKYIQRLCVPKERIIREAKADWEQYEKKFRDRGMVPADAPYVEYLFTEEDIDREFKIHDDYAAKRYA